MNTCQEVIEQDSRSDGMFPLITNCNDLSKNAILWRDTTQGLLSVWYRDGVTKTSGAPLSPNKINPTWRMMGFGLLD